MTPTQADWESTLAIDMAVGIALVISIGIMFMLALAILIGASTWVTWMIGYNADPLIAVSVATVVALVMIVAMVAAVAGGFVLAICAGVERNRVFLFPGPYLNYLMRNKD